MKRSVAIGVLAFLSAVGVGSAAPSAEAAGGGTYYWMYCRGHFGVRTATWVAVTGTKASGAATAGLRPGECAWKDRALNASEQAVVMFNAEVPANIVDQTKNTNKTMTILTCASSTDCVLVFKARNNGEGTMEANPNHPPALDWERYRAD